MSEDFPRDLAVFFGRLDSMFEDGLDVMTVVNYMVIDAYHEDTLPRLMDQITNIHKQKLRLIIKDDSEGI